MKKILNFASTTIYLIMCILFTELIYIYFSDIFLNNHSTWPVCISVIAGIVLIDYISRRYIKNLILFFLIHILIIGGSVVISSVLTDRLLLGCISFAYLLMAINFWKTDANERSRIVIDIPFAGIVAFIIVYIHSSYGLSPIVHNYAYISGIAFFLLYFIRDYLDKFLSYSLSSENFSDELKRTFTTNFSLIALFNVIIVLLIMVTNSFFSDSSFNVIGRFFKWLARQFFKLFARCTDMTDKVESEPVTTPNINDDGDGNIIYAYTSKHSGPNIGNMIFKVFQVVIFIGIIVGIIYIIYSFIKQYMHRNNNTNDEIKDTKETIKRTSTSPKKEDGFLKKMIFHSNRDKIRKLYLNKVNASTKKNNRIIIRKSYTPDQISNSINKEETDSVSNRNLNELTSLYEKARYSDSEITKADVENAKRILDDK